MRNWGSEDNPPPEVVIECQRYEARGSHLTDAQIEVVESMFCDEKGEAHPSTVIMALNAGHEPMMFLLGHATVFVMNNEGKTVDTIYT